MHEMKVILATLISRFDFTAAPGFEPHLDLDRFNLFIALRSNNGVRIGVVARRTAKQSAAELGIVVEQTDCSIVESSAHLPTASRAPKV
jgi:hypothetical protein